MVVSFDPIKVVVAVLLVLLIVGTIPFTAGWVGGILLLAQAELKFEFGG